MNSVLRPYFVLFRHYISVNSFCLTVSFFRFMPPTRIHRAVYEAVKMVSVGQDVSQQLTKPVKELVEWNFPLSQVCL